MQILSKYNEELHASEKKAIANFMLVAMFRQDLFSFKNAETAEILSALYSAEHNRKKSHGLIQIFKYVTFCKLFLLPQVNEFTSA